MGSTPSSMDKPNATQQAKQTANSNDDRLRFLVKYGSSWDGGRQECQAATSIISDMFEDAVITNESTVSFKFQFNSFLDLVKKYYL